jgi:hypothetical protein
MAMSAEKRAEASERMKGLHASGKLGRAPKPIVARTPTEAYIGITATWSIGISVDWEKLPMPEAQQAYAQLRKEFEKAGFILNQRSMPAADGYTCFMCKKFHLGLARGTDFSYVNPQTGLMQPVSICGELCWIHYQELRIKERKERELIPRNS